MALDLDHTGSVITVPAQSGNGIAISATGPVGYAVGFPNGAPTSAAPLLTPTSGIRRSGSRRLAAMALSPPRANSVRFPERPPAA